MKTILVTGGAGYVGSGLLRDLLDDGYDVVCLDSLRFGGESLLHLWHSPRFSLVHGDVNDHDLVRDTLERHRVDGVIHLAAIVGDPACAKEPELATQTNLHASQHLLEAADEYGVKRFVFASTCSNYGKMADGSGYVDENAPLAPVSHYAELKVAFEKYLLNEFSGSDRLAPTALRFATVYGASPRMRFDLTVNEFTKELALGREMPVYGEQFWRPYCHVVDFSRAFRTVLQAPRASVDREVFNVGSTRENYTKQMIVDEIKAQIPTAQIRYVHKDEDPRDYRVNFDKIRERLGFEVSRTVADGVGEVKEIVQQAVVKDPDSPRFSNV